MAVLFGLNDSGSAPENATSYLPFHIGLKVTSSDGVVQFSGTVPLQGGELAITLPFGSAKVEALLLAEPLSAPLSKEAFCAIPNLRPTGIFHTRFETTVTVSEDTAVLPVKFEPLQYAKMEPTAILASKDQRPVNSDFALRAVDMLSNSPILDLCRSATVEFKANSKGFVFASLPLSVNSNKVSLGLQARPGGKSMPLPKNANGDALSYFFKLDLDAGTFSALPRTSDVFGAGAIGQLADQGADLFALLRHAEVSNGDFKGTWFAGLPFPEVLPQLTVDAKNNAQCAVSSRTHSFERGEKPKSDVTWFVNNVIEPLLIGPSVSLNSYTAGSAVSCRAQYFYINAKGVRFSGDVSAPSDVYVVPGTRPVVGFTSPASNAIVPSSFTLAGSCQSGLVVTLNGVTPTSTTCSASAFSQSVTLAGPDGAKTVTASQTDSAGNVTTAASLSLTRDATAPVVAFTSPANNSTVPGSLTLSGSCESGLSVTLTGVTPTLTTCSASAFSQSVTLAGPDGAKTVTASQTDAAGNVSTAASLSLTLDATAPPSIVFTSPAINAAVPGTFTLAGSCEPGLTVIFTGVTPTTATCSSSVFSKNVIAASAGGPITVTASQTDAAGNAATPASLSLTVNPSPLTDASFGTGAERRSFFDATTSRHWSFVARDAGSSTTLFIENSADGSTWNFVSALANESADFAVTARAGRVYLLASTGNAVTVRAGTLSASAVSFGTPVTALSASGADKVTNPTAVLNATGNLWVGALHRNALGAQPQVRRSTDPANVSLASWEATSSVGTRGYGQSVSLVPRSSDDLYLLVQREAAEGFAFTGGAWSAQMAGSVQSWFSVPGTGDFNGAVNAAVFARGSLYVGGSFTTIGGVTANYIARWNGTAWQALGAGMSGNVIALATDSTGKLYVGGTFATAGGVLVNRVALWNGTHWQALGTGMNNVVHALANDSSGQLYAGGEFTTAGGVSVGYVAKWNGTSWQAVGTGTNGFVYALATDSAGNLYAGGSFISAGPSANRIARWNGTVWEALGAGMNNTVQALAIDSSGNLYAGGLFTDAGGVSATYVARWNGSAWQALGSGVNNSVKALATDSSGSVYVGGIFTTAGGVGANDVARWNGTAWQALGTGTNGYVNTLASDTSGKLYAGGGFDSAGGVPASNVALWNVSAWQGVGTETGVNADVTALASDSLGNLYAGGTFTTIGGVAANYVARWNGIAWEPLGSGMNSSVFALATDSSGNLYAGGSFATAGGVTVNRVARWNGTAWQALGTGMDNSVYALAIDSSGKLCAGGLFGNAGGVSAIKVACWNGTAWEALGTGMNGQVNSLAADSSGNLYAAGTFTTAGGVSVNRIARWYSGAWQAALGTGGMSGTVYALAIDSSGILYAGGDFGTAGGSVSASRVARWNGTVWQALGTGLNNSVKALATNASGHLIAVGDFSNLGGGALIWNGTAWAKLGNGPNQNLDALSISGTGKIHATSGPGIYELRDSIGSFVQSSAAGDTAAGHVHLAGKVGNNDIVYQRWNESTSTWGTPVTLALATSAGASRVGAAFNSTTGLGTALWRGTNGKLYRKDFNSAGAVAATETQVETSWVGEFLVSESGDGNLFTLFGREATWLIRRLGFTVVGP